MKEGKKSAVLSACLLAFAALLTLPIANNALAASEQFIPEGNYCLAGVCLRNSAQSFINRFPTAKTTVLSELKLLKDMYCDSAQISDLRVLRVELPSELGGMTIEFAPDASYVGQPKLEYFRISRIVVNLGHEPTSAELAQRATDFEPRFGTLVPVTNQACTHKTCPVTGYRTDAGPISFRMSKNPGSIELYARMYRDEYFSDSLRQQPPCRNQANQAKAINLVRLGPAASP